MKLSNNTAVNNALNNLLTALDYAPEKFTLGNQPSGNIKQMTAKQRRDRLRPLIERKFYKKYPFP